MASLWISTKKKNRISRWCFVLLRKLPRLFMYIKDIYTHVYRVIYCGYIYTNVMRISEWCTSLPHAYIHLLWTLSEKKKYLYISLTPYIFAGLLILKERKEKKRKSEEVRGGKKEAGSAADDSSDENKTYMYLFYIFITYILFLYIYVCVYIYKDDWFIIVNETFINIPGSGHHSSSENSCANQRCICAHCWFVSSNQPTVSWCLHAQVK
jgi:hypothetical protein